MVDQSVVERLEQLHGAVVTQLRVDNALTLVLSGSADLEPASLLRIEGSFVYLDRAGDEYDFADDYPKVALGSALDLFNETVAGVAVSAVGDLTLDFDSGARIRVPVDPRFEAWTLSAHGQATLVSPPGGGPPVWPLREYGSADPESAG